MLSLIVCLKQVPDPEAPSSVYKVDEDGRHIICKGVPPVISTYDENALEAALRIKDKIECKITVISAGKTLSKAILRKSLAVGADNLILLDDKAFADLDSYATVTILTAAISKLEKWDLILTGIQAADTNAGVVGLGIAEQLTVSCVTNVRKIATDGYKIIAERVLPDGYETVETTLPAVLTVHKSLGDLRAATTAALMEAQKRTVTLWTADDLKISPLDNGKLKLIRYYIPHREPCVEMISENTPEKAGITLASRLFSTGMFKK